MSTPDTPRIPWRILVRNLAQGALFDAVPASDYPQEQAPYRPSTYLTPASLPPAGWRPGCRQEQQELGYHRLSHADPKGAWWKPLVEAVIGVPLYLLLSLVLSTAILIPSIMRSFNEQATSGELTLDATDTAAQLQERALTDPLIFVLFFGSVALMFPCLWLARLIIGPKPWGLIHSVAGRMRWSWLASCLGLATLLVVALPLALDLVLGARYTPSPTLPVNGIILMLVAIILVVPLQAYAEELVFRGYLMQTIGRWLKHPAWAILIPAPLFMLGHLYDLWGQLSVLVMGLAAGYITWRTGGLEAAIALHVVNNLLATSFGLLGMADPFLQEGSTLPMFISAVVSNGLFVLVVVWAARTQGIGCTRSAQVWVKQP